MISFYIVFTLLLFYLVFYRSLPGGYIIYVVISIVRSVFQPRLKRLDDESTISFRVWFCDIDNYGHMNNSNYNLYCDYGRYNIAVRMWGIEWLTNAYCVVAASNVQYLRPMKLFDRFTLHTSIISLSGKNCWFKQVFVCNGKVHAVAVMKMIFLDKSFRSITVEEALCTIMKEEAQDRISDGKYSARHYEKIGDAYLRLNGDIIQSIEKEYEDRNVPVQIHSSRIKEE